MVRRCITPSSVIILTAVAILLTYDATYRYVAGYLDMTSWANPDTATNLSVAFLAAFMLLGAGVGAIGYKIYEQLKVPKKWLQPLTVLTTLVASYLFAWLMSFIGVEGFKFA